MPNWSTLSNESIIYIIDSDMDVNKIHLDDAKEIELWDEFSKPLTITKRLEIMQDPRYKFATLPTASLPTATLPTAKVASIIPPPPPTEASSLTMTPSADDTIIKKKIMTCATCGSTEHNKRRCPVKCSNCNAEGHKSRNCPLPKPEKKRKAETDEAVVDGTAQPPQKKKKKTTEAVTSQPAPIPPPVTNNLISSPMSATPTPIQEDADE